MSEEKKAVTQENKSAKKAESGKLSKVLNWFAKLPQRIAKPFKNMWYELKKVTWPSKKKLVSYSIIVLLFMLFMGVVIGLLDLGASTAVRALIPSQPTQVIEIPADALTEEVAGEATDAAEEVADAAEEAAGEAADAVEETAGEVAEAAEEAVDQVAETVEENVQETATEGE